MLTGGSAAPALLFITLLETLCCNLFNCGWGTGRNAKKTTLLGLRLLIMNMPLSDSYQFKATLLSIFHTNKYSTCALVGDTLSVCGTDSAHIHTLTHVQSAIVSD